MFSLRLLALGVVISAQQVRASSNGIVSPSYHPLDLAEWGIDSHQVGILNTADPVEVDSRPLFGQVRAGRSTNCSDAEVALLASALTSLAMPSAPCAHTCIVADMLYHPDTDPAEIQLQTKDASGLPIFYAPDVGRIAQLEYLSCEPLLRYKIVVYIPGDGMQPVPYRFTSTRDDSWDGVRCCGLNSSLSESANVGADGGIVGVGEEGLLGAPLLRVTSMNMWNVNPSSGVFPDKRDRFRSYLLRTLHAGDVSCTRCY
jgi:hypothetical protein